MSEIQIQVIKDVIQMATKVNFECLMSVKEIMEKSIDNELLKLEPSVILENMDITEKVMYLDYLLEDDKTKDEEKRNSISFEDALKKEGLTLNDLQDNN